MHWGLRFAAWGALGIAFCALMIAFCLLCVSAKAPIWMRLGGPRFNPGRIRFLSSGDCIFQHSSMLEVFCVY